MKYLWRRRNLTWLGLLLVFALVVAACGDDEGESTTTAPATTTQAPTTSSATTTTMAPTTTLPQKPYGGQVIIGDDQEPPTLNPFAPGGDNFIVQKIAQAWQCGTQEIDGYTLELIPELVTELPTVDNGGMTINDDGTLTVRYQIRDEAVWEDGTPVSGFDYEFTYQTIMNPDYPIYNEIYKDIDPESVVAGDKTFEYTLAYTTIEAENLFGAILPKHQIEGTDFMSDYNTSAWLSCGPFRLVEWQPGEYVRLERNPNYWQIDPETGQQLPYLDSVIYRFIPESASLVNAFKAREVDVINPPPSDFAVLQDLQALEPEGASIEILAGPSWEHLNFSFSPNSLEVNPRSYGQYKEFRRAVAYAIDKAKIIDEILLGQVEPMDSFIEAYFPPLSGGAWAQYDYNPDSSRQALTELCALEGVDCEANPPNLYLRTTQSRAVQAELYTDMFAEVGIEYTYELFDSQLFFGQIANTGTYDVAQWTWTGTPTFAGLVGILSLWSSEAVPPNGQNYYHWGTPAVTDAANEIFNQGASLANNENTARFAELVTASRATLDRAELEAIIAEAEQILADELIFVPIFQRLDPGAVWADSIVGFKHNPTQASDEWNIQYWYRGDL